MGKGTLAQRCSLVQRCIPKTGFRRRVEELHGDLLAEIDALLSCCRALESEQERLCEHAVPLAATTEEVERKKWRDAIRRLEISHTGMSYGDEKAGEVVEYTRGFGDCLAGLKKAVGLGA